MAVSSTLARSGPFQGNGVTTIFERQFRVLTAAEVAVFTTSQGVRTKVSAGFTLTGIGENQGTVVFDVAPPLGTSIEIERATSFLQESDYRTQAAVDPEVIENDIDRGAMRDQDLARRIGDVEVATDNIAQSVQTAQGAAGVAQAARDVAVAVSPTSPETFSAGGLGATDDSGAFASAHNAVIASGGAVMALGRYRFDSPITISMDGSGEGEGIVSYGPGQASKSVIVNNATGGVTFTFDGGVGRQFTTELQNHHFEPALADSGYPFRIVGNPGGSSTQAGIVLKGIGVGPRSENEAREFSDGVQAKNLYRPQVEDLKLWTSNQAQVKLGKAIDMDETFFPSIRDMWVNVSRNLGNDLGGADVGLSMRGAEGEGGFVSNITLNGADTGFDFHRTAREPHFQVLGGHLNSRQVNCRLNGTKFAYYVGLLCYCSYVEPGIEPKPGAEFIDFLVEDADGVTFAFNQFRQAQAKRRHFHLEPDSSKAGAVVRNVVIYLDQSCLFANTAISPIYLNGATNVTIHLPDEVSSADLASYPSDLIEYGPNQDPEEVRIVMQSGLTALSDGSINGPTHTLFHDSSAPATNQVLGQYEFKGRNSNGAITDYAEITGQIVTTTAGNENGQITFRALDGGMKENLARFIRAAINGSTSLLIQCNNSGTLTLKPVTQGAADSGGVGFRALRVPN